MTLPTDAGTAPQRGLVEYVHCIYGLHALAVLVALLGARSVALRFAFGLPSLLAVILNYARRSEARGSWLASHFQWQIRTFWFAWLWIAVTSIVAMPLLIIWVGFLVARLGFALIGLWVIYRIARGWLALREGVAIPSAAP
ncbi:MAG TPA: hypothetical protein VN859_06635 [Steroidobacteraceae bacterium]|nr:hypothetical protein [Steroidobacteraceae bacterium]